MACPGLYDRPRALAKAGDVRVPSPNLFFLPHRRWGRIEVGAQSGKR